MAETTALALPSAVDFSMPRTIAPDYIFLLGTTFSIEGVLETFSFADTIDSESAAPGEDFCAAV